MRMVRALHSKGARLTAKLAEIAVIKNHALLVQWLDDGVYLKAHETGRTVKWFIEGKWLPAVITGVNYHADQADTNNTYTMCTIEGGDAPADANGGGPRLFVGKISGVNVKRCRLQGLSTYEHFGVRHFVLACNLGYLPLAASLWTSVLKRKSLQIAVRWEEVRDIPFKEQFVGMLVGNGYVTNMRVFCASLPAMLRTNLAFEPDRKIVHNIM